MLQERGEMRMEFVSGGSLMGDSTRPGMDGGLEREDYKRGRFRGQHEAGGKQYRTGGKDTHSLVTPFSRTISRGHSSVSPRMHFSISFGVKSVWRKRWTALSERYSGSPRTLQRHHWECLMTGRTADEMTTYRSRNSSRPTLRLSITSGSNRDEKKVFFGSSGGVLKEDTIIGKKLWQPHSKNTELWVLEFRIIIGISVKQYCHFFLTTFTML